MIMHHVMHSLFEYQLIYFSVLQKKKLFKMIRGKKKR